MSFKKKQNKTPFQISSSPPPPNPASFSTGHSSGGCFSGTGANGLVSCRGVTISFPYVTFNSRGNLQNALPAFCSPLNINLALTQQATLQEVRMIPSELFLVSAAKVKSLEVHLGTPGGGLIASLLCMRWLC